jgi:hypothetical protein
MNAANIVKVIKKGLKNHPLFMNSRVCICVTQNYLLSGFGFTYFESHQSYLQFLGFQSIRSVKWIPITNGKKALFAITYLCVYLGEKKLNNFWWNEKILLKFTWAVQLFTSNFWAGFPDQPNSWIQPLGKKTGCFFKLYLLLDFLSYNGVTYFLEPCSLGPKNWEPNFDFWGKAQNIGAWMAGTGRILK